MRLIDADAFEDSLGIEDKDIYVKRCIEERPTINPDDLVKHGEWKDETGDVHSTGKYRYCSLCGGSVFIPYFSKQALECTDFCFCPNCGAKMDGGKNDE